MAFSFNTLMTGAYMSLGKMRSQKRRVQAKTSYREFNAKARHAQKGSKRSLLMKNSLVFAAVLASFASGTAAFAQSVPVAISCHAVAKAASGAEFVYRLNGKGSRYTDGLVSLDGESARATVFMKVAGSRLFNTVFVSAELEYLEGGVGHFFYNVPASVHGLIVGHSVGNVMSIRHSLAPNAQPLEVSAKCELRAL